MTEEMNALSGLDRTLNPEYKCLRMALPFGNGSDERANEREKTLNVVESEGY